MKKLLFLILFCVSAALAQQGPPISVGPGPRQIPVQAPFLAATVTIVQISGTSTAYSIYTAQGALIANQAAGSTYTFSPQPALTFPQGQIVGFISIPSGTVQFRATAIAPSSGGVTTVTGVSPVTSTGGTTPAIGCATCTNNPSAYTTDGVVYATGANTTSDTAAGTAGQVLTSNGAGVAPTYQAPSGGGVSSVTATTPIVSSGGTTPVISCPTCSTSAGTVTSVSGTANQIDVATGTTTPVVSLDPAIILPGSLTVPTGSSILASGSGTIAATSATALAGTPTLCSTGSAPTGILASGNATGCAAFGSTTPSFSTISNGTNTTAAMVLGTGSSLTVSGGGTNNATTLNGATFAAPGAIGGTTAGAGTFTNLTSTANGALSAPAQLFNCTPITGGSGTTTVPNFYLNSTGSTQPSTWSTSGTCLGMNLPSAFAGNPFDIHINGGASVYNIAASGALTTSSGATFGGSATIGTFNLYKFNSSSQISAPANGFILLANSGASGLTCLDLGGTTAGSFPCIAPNGAGISIYSANGTSAPTTLSGITAASDTEGTYNTATNCSSSASPAVCGSAAAGSVTIAAAATTVQVNTTAVTANSQIMLMYDSSLGTKLGVTCNTTEPALYGVTGRTAGSNFTITATSPITNPACLSYVIFN